MDMALKGRVHSLQTGVFVSKTVIAAIALLYLALAGPSAATPGETFAKTQKIVTADGIQKEEFVTIGDIRQWISVRGRHKNNPILLFLHGGPGFTVSPVSYHYMRDWEEYFTVVQWDQRGAGKTWQANDPAALRPTMTIDRMVSDAEELAIHLRATYGKKRIVLMAHSFGTILGTKLAQRRPDLFYAYVGMGQFVDAAKSEKMGFDATLAAARAANNSKAIAELTAIAPFPDAARPERNMQNLGKERFWLATYGGYYWRGMGHFNDIAAMSPTYSTDDLKARDAAQGFSIQQMWDALGKVKLTGETNFKCPVLIIQGRHDLGTSATLAGEWFASLKAPSKQIVWFEDSAHMVYEEEPGKLLVTLVEKVLPLTRGR